MHHRRLCSAEFESRERFSFRLQPPVSHIGGQVQQQQPAAAAAACVQLDPCVSPSPPVASFDTTPMHCGDSPALAPAGCLDPQAESLYGVAGWGYKPPKPLVEPSACPFWLLALSAPASLDAPPSACAVVHGPVNLARRPTPVRITHQMARSSPARGPET